MSQPKVSVLVPTYNAVPFLEQALDSLVAQTLEDIEIIVINDGSTDRSPEIIAEYASRDPRFVVINKTNSGYGATMNLGLDRAKGRYIGILEPDDYASPLMFERLYEAAEKHRADVAKANFNAIRTTDGISVEKVDLFVWMPEQVGKPFRPLDDERVFRIRPSIWAGIYRTDFLRRHHVRFTESPGASFQDTGFSFKVWATADRAILLDEPYLYYRTDNTASSVKDPTKIWAVADEYAAIKEFAEKSPRSAQLLPILQGSRFEAFRWNLDRLTPEIRPEFFDYTLAEYRRAAEEGQIDVRCFHGNNWLALQQLLADPQVLRDADYRLYPPGFVFPETVPTAPAAKGTPLVSVVIPVFNSERFLAACLDSVLAQTHENLEVLCIDDGSTDLSPEILSLYAARDPRVKAIRQDNAGAGVARNTGIDLATGDFFSFLDADDVFEPDMIERALEACETAQADFCVFRCDAFHDGNLERRYPIAHGIRRHLLPSSPVFAARDMGQDAFSAFQGWAWDKLYRADFVRRHGIRFQALRTTNDLRFVYTALVTAERIVTVDKVLAHQRREVTTSLSRTRERSWDNFYKALNGLREEMISRGVYDRFARDFANYALQLALWNLRTLQGASFHLLYDALKNEWFDELGVIPNDPDFFYSPDDEVALRRILSLTSREYAHRVLGHDEEPEAGTPTPPSAASERPDLSVIVPVYNVADYLEACLDSVLAFENVNLELVCIDDGSTDASLEILNRYARLSARVTVVTQENSGLSATRNHGLAIARGRYVAFLDSDDIYNPVDLGGLVQRAVRDDLDVLCFDGVSFRDDGVTDAEWANFDGYYTRTRDYRATTDGATLLANMREHHEYRVSCCLALLRLDFLRETGLSFIPGILHEDNAFTFAVMVNARRAAHERVGLYGRRVRPGSIMTASTLAKSAHGYLVSLASMLDALASTHGRDERVATHLGGVAYQVLANARSRFAQVPRTEHRDLLHGRAHDPLHHFLAQTMKQLPTR